MAHKMTREDRLAVVSGNAWHHYQIGMPLPDSWETMTADERSEFHRCMARQGGWDFNTGLYPAYAVVGVDADGKPQLVEIPDTFGVVREDQWRAFPGSVGKQFRCVQPLDMWKVMDPLVTGGAVTPETFGTLEAGQTQFGSYKISDREVTRLDGTVDSYQEYIVASNGSGNGKAAEFFYAANRPVCHNTLSWAMKGSAHRYMIRHSGDIGLKLETAEQVLHGAHLAAEQRQQTLQELANRPVGAKAVSMLAADLLERIDKALADPRDIKGETEAAEKARVKADKAIETRTAAVLDIVKRFRDGMGNHGESALDAFNGFIEHYDHQRSAFKKAGSESDLAERHFKRMISGDGVDHKAIAVETLLKRTA